jgi:hypothetical protein
VGRKPHCLFKAFKQYFSFAVINYNSFKFIVLLHKRIYCFFNLSHIGFSLDFNNCIVCLFVGGNKKLIGAFLIDNDSKEDSEELLKGDTLIRANFGINPDELDEVQWAKLVCEAIWIERFRLQNQADLLAALFGGKRKR